MIVLHFYISIIRPVLEYAVAIWHTGLTAYLSDQLEAVQRCALRIIFGGCSFTNQSYEYFIYTLDISPLSARRDDLVMRFFHTLLDPASCLYHLIPNKRDNFEISKLRKPAVYEVPFARTNKFRNSLISYALNNYMASYYCIFEVNHHSAFD